MDVSSELAIPASGRTRSATSTRRRAAKWRWGAAILVVIALAAALVARYAEPSAVRWRQSHARELLLKRKNVEALADLRAALRRDLNNPNTLLLIARVHRRLGNLHRVPILLNQAAAQGGDAERIQREFTLLLAQSGELSKAEPQLPQLLAEAGEDGPDVCQAYVQGFFSNARTQDAVNLLDVWQQSYPDDPEPIFMRAFFTQGLNQYPQAITLYKQGLAMDPSQTLMRLRLAESLIAARRFEEAESELSTCEKEVGPQAQSQYLLSQCAYERGDPALALLRIDSALHHDPNHLEARRLRGQMHLAAGELELALADLQAVADRQPYDTFTRDALGRTLRQLGKTGEAKKHLDYVAEAEQSVRQLDRLIRQSLDEPKNAELRFQIGSILARYGPPDDAVKWMRAVIELNPNHAGARQSLAEYYEARGDFRTAGLHRQLAARNNPPP